MARKTEVFKLSADTYRITQLGADEGSELWDDILAAVGAKIGPKLQDISAVLSTGTLNEKTLALTLGPIVLEVIASVPKDLKRRWRKLFEATTEVEAGQVWLNMADTKLFNEHFAGRYGAMTAWEMTCLKHNFLDFLPSKPERENSAAGE